MSGSVKKNQLKATIKIPGEQREKKCTAAHEKLNLNKTDRVNKLTAAQIDTLVSKKQEGVCLDFTSPCFQFENSEWLNDFPNVLKELDLTGQSMAEFHVEHLGKLKNLILSKNSISKMLYDGLVNLEQLVLSNNRIEQLYDMGDLKKLVSLDLSSNRIATGWVELEKLQSLRVLDLADCSIDLTISEFYNFVLAPLKKIHKLEYVNFMGNPVEKNISEFKYFIINEMPKLKYLDWDPITKSDRQLAEKLSAEGKWSEKTKATMVKRGSLVTIARPERPERPDRPVNNREKEKDPNAPGSRLSVLLKDENYSVGTLRAMEQLDAIISANLSDGDELNKLEEMLKSSNGDGRQQVDYLSLLNDMVTDDTKQASESEKADLVVRGSTIDNLMAGLNVDLNIEEKPKQKDSKPTSSEPKSDQKSGDFLDMLTDIINEAPKSNGTAAKTPAKPAASQPEQKDYLALLDEMMNMSAEIETPLSPRTIKHQKKSPRAAMNELEETLSSMENAQQAKPETTPEVKPTEASKPEPVTPVVTVAAPKGAEIRKSLSLVDELAASIDSLEDSIRRNSPSVTRKSNDSIPPVPPQPSNPKIVMTNSQGSPKGSPKKDAPKIGVKVGVKAGAKKPKQSVSGEADSELQKKLGRMRERSESQQNLSGASPSKPSELDSVLDSLAALSQQPLDKSKGPALNLSNSAATTASITDLIDSYSSKPLPSPPPKRKSNDSDSEPKESPKPVVPQPEVKEPKPEPALRPKSGSVSISPQIKPDANPLGNLLDQLIVSATSKPKLGAVTEETPKKPPPLSMSGVVATSNSVTESNSARQPMSPVDTSQIDEYLAVKTPSKSNLEHQPRYVRGLEPRTRPQWDADMNEIDIRERLGQGIFGETWMAFWSGEIGRKVTVKKLVDLDFSSAALEALRSETKKLMYLKHPNLAGVIGSGVKDAKYIMAEYIEGVSAYAYLRNPSVPIGSPFILSMARQAAAGLYYLHEQGIIHGSFKSKNVLIDRDNVVHLKDYGYLDSKDVIDRLDAQPQYLAPEVITGAAYTEKIDIYSFGMFLWELFTKQTPFIGLTPNQVVDEIIYRQLRPEVPPTCPIVFEKLIRACWSTDPNQRPGFDKIIKILNMSEDKIFSYGDRLPSTPAASTKSLGVPGSSSPVGPRYNKPKRLSAKFSADEEQLDPETATKLNMVLDRIIELILSNETQSQLRGVKSIETLLKTPGRLPYIARNTDVIRALIVMIDTPIPPGPLSPELEIVEVAVRVIMELSKHPSMGQPLREYRAIGAFVRLLNIEGRDGLAIMAAKAMSQFALDPENSESIKLSGALIPLVNLLHSNNEFVLIQVCSVLTALLEDEESSKNFLTAGGLERLLEMLQLSNPALQLRVLDVLSNYLGNEEVQPHLAAVNIKSKYLSMLNAPSPALKATGVKAMTKFAQKNVIKEESEIARVLKALIDTVTISTDAEMIVNALKALTIFSQQIANAVVFRNIGGLSMTFRALNNGNLDIVKSAMELFANLLKDDIGRDALIALGSCGPLVKYLPYEDRVLRLVLLNNLLQLVDKNDKGIRGLAAAAGVTPVVSILCYSDSDEEKILALKIVSNVATNPELCNDVREAGGVPVLLELLDKKSSEALLIKGAETLQLLVEQNALNRTLLLQEQGLSLLTNSLLYLPVRAQEHVVNLFGVYAREGLKSGDLLTAVRSSGAIQALAQMLSLRAEEEQLVLATIRLMLTLTQDEHTKGLVRDLTMIELQKLTLSPNSTIQNAAKKIVSLF